MTSERVKRSAIPYAGYGYQTLQGVRLLAEWLDAPTRYQRMRFEADSDAVAPQGLDDVVCERTDGKFDFLQVKFTPSPDKPENQLSWDWLLSKDSTKPRSRSLLRKWFDALNSIDASAIGQVSLLTNRIPDADMASCLEDVHVNLAVASAQVQQTVAQELGSPHAARAFFERLFVRHSDKGYLSLEREVTEEVAKHTDEAGVHRLVGQARHWAIFKDLPAPDGWITLPVIRAVLSTEKPEPIPEDFLVPFDYRVPDEDFHEELKRAIAMCRETVITVYGPPGRGKSTYLSFLSGELAKNEVPFVRHHYFLSLVDRTADRLSPRLVAESLLGQIASFHSEVGVRTDKPEHLAEALGACAAHYKAVGKPFVVIVDGLDHVWRDNERDKRPLDDFFNQLLPTPENLVVVVGTQPVDDDKLPERLLRYCPRDRWRLLPSMSQAAVLDYLRHQVKAGRVQVDAKEARVRELLAECANSLHSTTGGHPLHLIYSVEELVGSMRPLSTWAIERLSKCPGPDIRSYYAELWTKLSQPQQDVLHLCSEFPLCWPRTAFMEMGFDTGARRSSVGAVEHLLHDTVAGLKPFHESLVVFIREQPNHRTRIQQLRPTVRDWLENDAPDVYRQSWLWSLELQLGIPEPMQRGLTRDWILDRLTDGYPLETILRILDEAEGFAFEKRDYAAAYRYRALVTRLLNGPEFQVSEVWRLFQHAWTMTSDESVLDDLFASHHELEALRLAGLSLALVMRGRAEPGRKAAGELLERRRRESRLKPRRHSEESRRIDIGVLQAAAYADALDLKRMVEAKSLDNLSRDYLEAIVGGLVSSGALQTIVVLWQSSEHDDVREVLESAALRTALDVVADLTAWEQFVEFGASSLVACWAAAKSVPLHKLPSNAIGMLRDGGSTLRGDGATRRVCEWFWKSLLTSLVAAGEFDWIPSGRASAEPTDSQYLDALTEFAELAAKRLRLGKAILFDEIFSFAAAKHFDEPSGFEQQQGRATVFRALVDIAGGCQLLASAVGGDWHVSTQSVRGAESSSWFSSETLLGWCIRCDVTPLTNEAAFYFLERLLERQRSAIEETNQRAETLLDMTDLAVRHEIPELARRTCRLCWDYVLGYGGHKDITLLLVLDAIEHLASRERKAATNVLASIGPQIGAVTDYTDGDETRHAHNRLSELLARFEPSGLVRQYGEETKKGNWHRADDAIDAFVKHADLTSPVASSVARTGLSLSAIGALSERAAGGDSAANATLAAARNHLGSVTHASQPAKLNSTEDKSKFNEPFADYPPERYADLRAAMKGSFGNREYLIDWYQYWMKGGKESDLLSGLKPTLLADDLYFDDAAYLLDPLFETCFRLEGPDKAFELAVKAQETMLGWDSYFERGARAERRLRKVAELYPARADEFIQRSCKTLLTNRRQPSPRVVPGERLVFFLVQLGRIEEASKLVDAMAMCVREDTRNLALETPSWAKLPQ